MPLTMVPWSDIIRQKKKAGVRIESAKKKEVVQRVCGSDVDEMARQEAEVEKLRANQDMNFSFFFFI